MTNAFKGFVKEGKSKVSSLGDRLKELEDIIESLHDALHESDPDISLETKRIDSVGNDGYSVEMYVKEYRKRFFSLTIPDADENEVYIKTQNNLHIVSDKEDLINALGQEVSSISFWRNVEELKRLSIALDDDIPF